MLLYETAVVRLERVGLQGPGGLTSGAPLQQFSVRKLSNAFMVSNLAA
jgi:hypothetical protein